MSHESDKRRPVEGTPIPKAPPLPAPKPLQRAREAAYRFIGYPSQVPDADQAVGPGYRHRGSNSHARYAILGQGQNASASHRTGLEINTIAINESGTHALIGGKEVFKTIRVENGACAEDVNLRAAIRSRPTDALGQPRYSEPSAIDIADVAWAKGDCGDFVAAATASGRIILYDLGHAGLPAAQLYEHDRQVHKVTFNPHRGNLLLSGSQDGSVRLWDLRDVRTEAKTLQSRRKFSGQSDGVRDVKWSPTEGVDFAFGSDSGFIQRWDIRNLKAAKVKIAAHSLSCNIIDWHPDGKHIASAGSDKTVRVWDFSAGRRGKASWEIKTPYPVLNARWRPPCEAVTPDIGHAQQCTQLVTAYDAEHPVVHVWDFRRPLLPFRELQPYPSAPTDLLWHSQDLLWTVGREGTFLQTDIQHAPKVLDNRNLQAVAVSGQGEVTMSVQKRSQRHLLKGSKISYMPDDGDAETAPPIDGCSRSWQDDGLDDAFLRMIPSKHRIRSYSGSKASGNYHAPQTQQAARILMLHEVLHNRKSSSPQQHAVRGCLPYHTELSVIRTLANGYATAPPIGACIAKTHLEAIENAFEHNAAIADSVILRGAAKTWRMMAFSLQWHLDERIRHEHSTVPTEVAPPLVTADFGRLLMGFWAQRNALTDYSPPNLKPLVKQLRHLELQDSTSNVPTPLVKPVASRAGRPTSQIISELPDPDQAEAVALPPSLDPVSATADAPEQIPLTTENLVSHEQYQGTADRIEYLRRWSDTPKEPISPEIEPTPSIKAPPPLLKRDSDESFQFMFGSMDSKGMSLPSSIASMAPVSLVAERPSRHVIRDAAKTNHDSNTEPLKADHVPSEAEVAHIPIIENGPPASTSAIEDLSPLQHDDNAFTRLFHPTAEDLEADKPFRVVELLIEQIKFSSFQGDAQLPAHLLLLTVPLLPETQPLVEGEFMSTALHYADTYTAMYTTEETAIFLGRLHHTLLAGLNPLQIESILSTYHEQLLAHQLFAQAARLRQLAYPLYPAVYEDYLRDNIVSVKDAAAQKHHSQRRVECAFCGMKESPYGHALLAACFSCGHVAHATCLRMWFGSGEAGCPVEGCLCDCVAPVLPGQRR